MIKLTEKQENELYKERANFLKLLEDKLYGCGFNKEQRDIAMRTACDGWTGALLALTKILGEK